MIIGTYSLIYVRLDAILNLNTSLLTLKKYFSYAKMSLAQ